MKFHRERTGDYVDVPPELDGMYAADPEWAPVVDTTEPATDDVLKGAALDTALDQAGLPKTGSADEKRARLTDADQKDVTRG